MGDEIFKRNKDGKLVLSDRAKYESGVAKAKNSGLAQSNTVTPWEMNAGIDAIKETSDVAWKPMHGLDAYQKGVAKSEYLKAKKKADDQGFFGEAKGFITQAVVGETLLGTFEGFGYLLDVEHWFDKISGGEGDWGNWFSDIMEEGQEGLKSEHGAPIYVDPAAEGRSTWQNMMNTDGWWASNGVSVASSLSLLIPVAGWAKATGMVGKGLNVLAKGAKGLAKGTKASAKGATLFDTLLASNPRAAKVFSKGNRDGLYKAIVSRHLEGHMEAAQVFTQKYEELRQQGIPEEEAKRIAGQGAALTYNADWAMLMTDIPQYMLIGRGLKVNKPIFSQKLADAAKQSKGKALGLKFAKYGKQMASEGFEELYQFMAAEEGKHMVDIQAGLVDPNETTLYDRIGGYLEESEAWTSALFGALGGGLFQAVGPATSKAIGKMGGNLENYFDETKQRLDEITTRKARMLADVQAYHEAVEIGDERGVAAAEARIGYNIGVQAAKVGNLDLALANIQSLKNADQATREEYGLDDSFETNIDTLVENAQYAAQEYAKAMDKYHPQTAESIAQRKYLLHKYDQRLPELEKEIEDLKQEMPLINKLSPEGKKVFETELEILGWKRYQEGAKLRNKLNKNISEEEKAIAAEQLEIASEKIASLSENLKEVSRKNLSKADTILLKALEGGSTEALSKAKGEQHHLEDQVSNLTQELNNLTSTKFQAETRAAERGDIEALNELRAAAAEEAEAIADANKLNGHEEPGFEEAKPTAESKMTMAQIADAIDKGELDESVLTEQMAADLALFRASPHGDIQNAAYEFEDAETPANPSDTESSDGEFDYNSDEHQVVQEATAVAWLSANNKKESEVTQTTDPKNNQALTEFLENPGNLNGVTIRFSINHDWLTSPILEEGHLDLARFKSINLALKNGTFLENPNLDELIGHVPIKGILYKDGKPVEYKGQTNLQISLHRPGFFADSKMQEEQINVLKVHKMQIVRAELAGQTIEAAITDKTNGHILTESDPITGKFAKNNVATVLGKTPKEIEFVYGNKTEDGSLPNAYLDVNRIIHPDLYHLHPPTAGAIYAITRTANGSAFPLRMHIENISASEAEVIYDIYKDILADPTNFKQTISKDIQDRILQSTNTRLQKLGSYLEIEKITYDELLKHLIYEGANKTASKKESALYRTQKGGIQLGLRPMSQEEFLTDQGKQDFMTHLQENRRRQIDSRRLADPRYKEYLIKEEIMTTNATSTGAKNLFIQPNVIYSPDFDTTSSEVSSTTTPATPLGETTEQSKDIETQKADIERRRQEALKATKATTYGKDKYTEQQEKIKAKKSTKKYTVTEIVDTLIQADKGNRTNEFEDSVLDVASKLDIFNLASPNTRVKVKDKEELAKTDRYIKVLNAIKTHATDVSVYVYAPGLVGTGATKGGFATYSNELFLNRSLFGQGFNLEVLTHELLHNLTINALYPQDNKYSRDFDTKVTELYNLALKNKKVLGGEYGITNKKEFISEAFANPQFQAKLSQIKSGKGYKSNLFKDFLNTLKDFLNKAFGLTTSTSLLEDIVGLVGQHIELQSSKSPASINAKYDAELAALESSSNKEDIIQEYLSPSQKAMLSKLRSKYPELKVNFTQEGISFEVEGKTIWNQTNNEGVNYTLKSVDILSSDKAKDVFAKGKKNNWDLNKILTELQIPKTQKQLILDKEFTSGYVSELDLRENIITSLLAENSFVVEVNTAFERSRTDLVDGAWNFEYNGNKYYSMSYNHFTKNGKDITEEEFLEAEKKSKEIPTTHYISLGVPGGTNYTENEIATPGITPNIEGHAEFATDKGIGWFRSDDKTADELKGNWIKSESELPNEFVFSGERYFKENGEWQTKNKFIEDIETIIWRYNMSLGNERIQNKPQEKTRRVLEVQSDLFQKGRDSKKLSGSELIFSSKYPQVSLPDNVTKSKENIGTTDFGYGLVFEDINYFYVQTGERASLFNEKEGFFESTDIYARVPKSNPENDFLQLLNKKGNWVNFFIESIVQDSVKKGYEKVLFPTGETAAKIEGHQTIADEIQKMDLEIGALEQGLEQDLWDMAHEGLSDEQAKAKIKSLEARKAEMKTQGIEKLKPVEAFYTNRVTNILNKLYTVNKITDEYGNTWNEVDLTGEVGQTVKNILLQKNKEGQILGQANIEAATVLLDAENINEDTIPHEFAHHYIAWNRDTPLVQEAIKKWGSEEALVQAIGEQAVKQKGEAWDWWKKLLNWISKGLTNFSKQDKETLKNILTDAFLNRENLNKATPGIQVATDISPKARRVLNRLGFTDNMIKEMSSTDKTEALGFTEKADAADLLNKYKEDIPAEEVETGGEYQLEYPANTAGETKDLTSFDEKMKAAKKKKDDEGRSGVFSLYKGAGATTIDMQDEAARIRKLLPKSIAVNLQKDYIETLSKGHTATGLFRDGVITLMSKAPKGTAYHEAFHAVFRTMLSDQERKSLIAEAMGTLETPTQADLDRLEKTTGITSKAELINLFYEERLADEFADYMEADNKKRLGLSEGIVDFFNRLLSWITDVFSKKSNIDNLFKNISRGKFRNKVPTTTRGIAYSLLTSPDFTADQVQEITMQLTYAAMKDVTSLESISQINMANVTGALVDGYSEIDAKLEKGTITEEEATTLKERYLMVLDEETMQPNKFWQSNIKDFLINDLGLKPVKVKKGEEKDTQDEENILDLETVNFLKSSYEVSGKANATANIKFLIGLVPKIDYYQQLTNGKMSPVYEISGFLGLPKFNNYGSVWNTVETIMLGATPNKTNGLDTFQTMLARLDAESVYKPYLKFIADRLRNSDEHVQGQFHNVFSKQKGNYLLHRLTGVPGAIKSIIHSESLEAKETLIHDEWALQFKDNFTTLSENGTLIYDSTQIAKFNADLAQFQALLASKNTKVAFGQLKVVFDTLGMELDRHAVKKLIAEVGANNTIQGMYVILSKLRDGVTGLNAKAGKKYTDENNQITDNKAVFKNLFARVEASFRVVTGENMWLGPEGNKIWFYQDNNMMSKFFARFKSGDLTGVEMLKEGRYNQNSLILNKLIHPTDPIGAEEFRDSIEIGLYGNYRYMETGDKGHKASDLKPADQLHDQITKTIKHGILIGLAEADKGQQSYIKVGRRSVERANISIDPTTQAPIYNMKKSALNLRPVTILSGYLQDELARMKVAYEQVNGYTDDNGVVQPGLPEDKQLLYYHYVIGPNGERQPGNAFKSFLFPGLDLAKFDLVDSKGKPKALTPERINNPELREYIADAFMSIVKKDIAKAKEFNIINTIKDKETNKDKIVNNTLDQEFIDDAYTGDVIAALADYTLNSIIGNVEQTKLFNGDPALYKVKYKFNEAGQQLPWIEQDHFGDFMKRIPVSAASGADFRIFKGTKEGDQGVRPYYTSATVENIEAASDFFSNKDNIKIISDRTGISQTALNKLFKPYQKVNRTDAQAWITLDTYRERMRGLGKWYPEHEAAYIKAINEESLGYNEVKLLAQPLKTVHAELMPTTGGILSMQYNKQSEAVLLPFMTKGTELDNLRLAMESKDNPVDHVIVLDGKKVGAMGITSLTTEEGNMKSSGDILLKPVKLSYTNLFLQQDLSSKQIKETIVGIQTVKNTLSVVKMDEVYAEDEKTGREIYEEYHSVISKLSDLGLGKFTSAIGWDPETGFEKDEAGIRKVNRRLQKEIKDSVSDNTQHAINQGVDLDALPNRQKVENKLPAMLTKSAVRLKQMGGAFIQMSDFGFVGAEVKLDEAVKDGIIWFKNPAERLQPMTMTEDKVNAAQVLLPHSEMVRIFQELHEDYKSLSHKEIEAMVQSGALSGISYRIPNQAAASNDAIEIVGFLPPEMGDTMVAFSEITTKTGSDFDIDKAFVILPNLGVNKDTKTIYPIKYNPEDTNITGDHYKKGLENRRLELMRNMLMHPSAYVEVMAPLDDPYLLKFAEEHYPRVASTSDLGFFSGTTQLENKNTFDSAKNLVGPIANHLSHHSLILHENLYLKGTYLGKGKPTADGDTSLSNLVDEDGNNIANTLGMLMNAIVDAAKDPFISRMNINQQTAGTAFMLIRAGFSREWVFSFMGQPIIKDYIDAVEKKESTFSADIDPLTAMAEKYGVQDYESGYFFFEKNGLTDYGAEITTTTDELQTVLSKTNKGIPLIPAEEALQAQILTQFLRWRKESNKLNDLITICKVDVNGATKNLNRAQLAMNLMKRTLASGDIGNLENFLGMELEANSLIYSENNKKMIGTYFKNSVDTILEMFQEEFVHTTTAAKSLIQNMAASSGYLTLVTKENHEKVADTLANEIYTSVAATTDAFRLTAEELRDIIYGVPEGAQFGKDTPRAFSIMDRFKKIKTNPNLKENLLINALQLEEGKKGGPGRIYLPQNDTVKRTKDELYNAWEELLEKETAFAEDLIQYAFHTSGFSSMLGSFHEHIPMTYLMSKNFGEQLKQIKDTLAEDIHALDHHTDGIMKNIARKNNQLVPRIFPSQTNELRVETSQGLVALDQKETGFGVTAEHTEFIAGVSITGSPVFKPFVKIQIEATDEITKEKIKGKYITKLFQLQGYTANREAVYFRTNLLGYSKGPIQIKEFTGTSKYSIFAENQIPRETYLNLNSPETPKLGADVKLSTPVAPYDKYKTPEDQMTSELSPEEVAEQLNFCLNIG
jgi:hypothetical protein